MQRFIQGLDLCSNKSHTKSITEWLSECLIMIVLLVTINVQNAETNSPLYVQILPSITPYYYLLTVLVIHLPHHPHRPPIHRNDG